LATGNCEEARQRYREALQLALGIPSEDLRLDVVLAQAVRLLHEDRRGQAIELLTHVLALTHPQSMPATRRDAQTLLEQLRNEVELEAFAAAQERGRARDLQATVKELLAELEG